MRRSLFKKYLIFGISILLTSFIALSVTMYSFVNQYWEEQKKASLLDNAHQVADAITSYSSIIPSVHSLVIDEHSLVGLTVISISKSVDADILITDNKGICLYCSEDGSCIHKTRAFPSKVLFETTPGEYFSSGTLDGYYSDNRYTAGVPVMLDSDPNPSAFCYVTTKATFLSGLPVTFLQIFLTAAAVMLIIIIIFVAFMSYSMTKPLKQMSSAAKKFAVGDFSVRVNVTSDDEIGELATAFNYMADSLASSEAIAGFIDGMLDGTIPPERHDHYMKIVSTEVKRLSRLVTSMLNLSRIDRGELKVNRQKFDMFSLIITILASYEQKIIARKLHITGLEDFRSIIVDADPDLMYQVVYNLIENAVKFTDEGGTIHFGVEETRYDVSVSITNTGPGIPPEDIRYVFDRFYKTDKSRSIDKKGMGLGLFIAKTIMRLHGGDIYVDSRVNEFTTFTIRLPKTVQQSPEPNKEKEQKFVEATVDSETEE